MKTLSSNCFLSLLCVLLSVIYIISHQPFLSIIPEKGTTKPRGSRQVDRPDDASFFKALVKIRHIKNKWDGLLDRPFAML
jgi:hypothetical protein